MSVGGAREQIATDRQGSISKGLAGYARGKSRSQKDASLRNMEGRDAR